jgi:DNA-binding CsgD family transcriptional regulator
MALRRKLLSRLPVTVILILLIQGVSAFFFIFDILSASIGIWTVPLSWQSREMLEVGAALGLLLGVVLGAGVLFTALRDRDHAKEQLRRASAAFMDLLNERFVEWGLTPAERDVALFAIKGMSTTEIARLRETSEGTVKAQTNAIYRKAGVTGRSQLLSLFIDEMMRDADGADVTQALRLVPPAQSAA